MPTYSIKYLFIVFLLFFQIFGYAQKAIVIDSSSRNELNLADKIQFYADSINTENETTIIANKNFVQSEKDFLNFKITKATIWLRFTLRNESDLQNFKLSIDQLNIDEVTLYEEVNGRLNQVADKRGSFNQIIDPNNKVPAFVYELSIDKNNTRTYYFKVDNSGQLFIPIYLRSEQEYNEVWLLKFIIFGFYVGIVLALFFYNLFLTVTITDDKRSYIWYLLHTIFILLTQASFQGYSVLFLWPTSTFLAKNGIYLFTCLVSITGIEYAKAFLRTKEVLPKVHIALSFFHPLYLGIIALSVFGQYNLAYELLQPIQGMVAIFMLSISLGLVVKKSRLAIFYFISWSVLFISIILFVFTNLGILLYNIFTSQILLYGSAVQVILLSIAQADKYNILKIQEQEAQKQAIAIALLNEQITKEQNVKLEEKVEERTSELHGANKQLTETLNVLKETQIQLVEKEKMSSLGQLTAGIAHEINNPINFVSSNINPLKRDVKMLVDLMDKVEGIAKNDITSEEKAKLIDKLKDNIEYDYLKTEIDFLLKGIGEGAARTAEIVKGLKVFSRSDEFETKFADINEGIDSTLVLVNNQLGGKIKVEKNYQAEGMIEHYPGKLNQVFMNLLSNAIYAINKKWGDKLGGLITIETNIVGGKFVMTFSDNGIGMDEETVNKMFDPFFTTKEVGEGTGLGMSIVYKTIEMHEGKISVASKLGEGTEFTLAIPNKLNR